MEQKNILYIHGFASSPDSRTVRILELALSDYNIIAPEVSSDVQDSLNYLNRIISNRKIDLIIGTSLGGFYALACNNLGLPVIVINPTVEPLNDLEQFLGKNNYLNPRKDKSTSFNFTEGALIKFSQYEKNLEKKVENNKNLIYAIISDKDKTLRISSLKFFKSILDKKNIIKTDKIGHRLDDEYILHDLRDLVISILENDIDEEYRSKELEDLVEEESFSELELGPLFEHFRTFFNNDYQEKIKYIDQIWEYLQRAYSYIGGFMSAKSKEELIHKADLWKLCFKGGKLVAFNLYKTTKFGRKLIGGATDDTEIGKYWFSKIVEEDINRKERYTYAEVSGKMESYFRKMNANFIPYEIVKTILLGKQLNQELDVEDEKTQRFDFDKEYHYYRKLGSGDNKKHRKIMVGNVKEIQ